jgi:hypothetical protein
MTREELLVALSDLTELSPPSAHCMADALLLEWLQTLGYGDVVAAYVTLLSHERIDIP